LDFEFPSDFVLRISSHTTSTHLLTLLLYSKVTMYPVLFRIPWQSVSLGGVTVPVFGFGLLLLVWLGITGWTVYATYLQKRSPPLPSPDVVSLGMWGLVLLAILRAPEFGPRFAPQGLPINGYGVMMLCGLLCGIWLANRRARTAGLPGDVIWDLAVWLFIPGIIGARVFYLVQHSRDAFFGADTWPQKLFAVINLSNGGIVLYGGLIAGACGYFAFCYARQLRPLTLADVIVPSVFVGIGFGRLGCLLYGCCYGDACSLPWGITFPAESMPFNALVYRGFVPPDALTTPVLHPTQIYSSLDGFLTAALLVWYTPYRRVPGDVLALALIICPTTRFLLEIIRGDEYGQWGTSLTIAQWISIALLMVGLVLQLVLSWQAAEQRRRMLPAVPT
jgi:phosphatidylglycerol---prolipoprotein diacylglyceryl transferase